MIPTMCITLYNQINEIIRKAFKPKFMTSLEVINKVMNVPECALKAILRDKGYDAIETTSICIDEEMLMVFADAYVRKLRSYFISSNRNPHLLTPQESSDLEEFYTTFKKKEIEYTNVKNWNHIDTDLIRDYFVQEVKEQTPNPFEFYDKIVYRILANDGYKECIRNNVYAIVNNSQHEYFDGRNYKQKLLTRITHSLCYHSRLRLGTKPTNQCCITTIRQIYATARYHTFPVDNDDAHEEINSFISKEIIELLLTAS